MQRNSGTIRMATFRIPILTWQDFGGNFTSQAITGGEEFFAPTAFADKKDAVILQVKDYLHRLFEQEFWREPVVFEELNLLEFRVDIRPEYELKPQEDEFAKNRKKRKKEPKRRVFTSEETIPIRVACVFWKTENGNYSASLPLLEIEFFFNKESELKSLVTLKVQEALRNSTPLVLSNFLPNKQLWLEEVSVHVNRKEKRNESFKEVPNLISIAEPLGSKDVTKKMSKAYERETEVADLVKRLTKERANIIILGENGIGKTTLLTEAVKEIEKNLLKTPNEDEDFDDFWDDKNPKHRFWQTNGGRIISGMKYLGQWEERCEAIIGELSDIDGVLCAENLLDLVRYGGREPNESVASFLVPYLQRGELRMVAEATPTELDACRRLLPNFADSFQVVRLEEFTSDKALQILLRIAEINSRNLKIEYSANVINLVYRLFSRFMPYQKFPSRITQFLTDIFEKAKDAKQKEVTNDNVIENFIKLTGLPELFLRDEIALDFDDVVADFESQVIGQPQACQQVANIVTTFKAGLNDPKRPLGVFLFAGPTGVGKTELTKVLARFFFGNDENSKEKIVRLDMSEYSLGGSASRLLTKSDGEPSDLIQKVREKPFSVVLFDEVEKADTQVFDVLLGLFDEGRLTDRFGRVTNFTSTVVIMTSNLGAEKFAKGDIGFSESENTSSEKEIKTFFRPEFFNRLDGVIQFKQLDKTSVYKITEKEISSITKREGLSAKGIKLVVAQEVTKFLAEKGYDPRYGARPLQRTIETFLTSPLSKFLLENPKLKDLEIKVNLHENEQISFEVYLK